MSIPDTEKIAFKIRLRRWALDLITQRITASREAIDQAQQAANNEEKSSAGDKYETGRAMGHLQKDMHARQLAESIKELANLHAINVETLYQTAAPGAFIQCKDSAFFIAAGLGKQKPEDDINYGILYFLSPQAPLATAIQNKKPGESFVFNNNTITILEIF
jgi:hypothetical protein